MEEFIKSFVNIHRVVVYYICKKVHLTEKNRNENNNVIN